MEKEKIEAEKKIDRLNKEKTQIEIAINLEMSIIMK